MLRFSDLPARSRDTFLARVVALGLNPTLWEPPAGVYGWDGEPPNSFHGEGVGWSKGTFFYRADAEMHGFAHEVGHAAQLSPEAWAALDDRDPRTSEDVALLVQVEICRGIPGLGTGRMLSEMTQAGYCFTGLRIQDVDAAEWWREVVPRTMQDEHAAALVVAARWRTA